MLQPNLKQSIVKMLIDRLQPEFILLFGSYAKGTASADSDLDIAYYSQKKLSHYERFLLAGDLADLCNVEVDLADIRQVDTVFAAQIFSTGELIYCANKNIFVKERMKALSMYVTLNEQRAEILRGIRERGSIYG
ncbi:type VII toxin-antitoxin system MntA family adenylyltransferase antitoxin [Siminovitchia fortis]|uniref:type VII toxin-antitoxin system MntA family adenylyltransferase antitoxin n=1 Tax=Siminovitchia fortis TaxID=254758 RepID=UPI001FD30340|nr:nucleotidyltransferase domain-containing protein [Siminovitchia fortis]